MSDQRSTASIDKAAVSGTPVRHWFALRDGDGRQYLLPDSTVLRLMTIIAQPNSVRRSRCLIDLAWMDAGWASYLVSISQQSSDLSASATSESSPTQRFDPPLNAAPQAWRQIEQRVLQTVGDARLLDWLQNFTTTVACNDNVAQRWWNDRLSILHLAKQMTQRRWSTEETRRAVFWWAINLADPAPSHGLSSMDRPMTQADPDWRELILQLDSFARSGPPTSAMPIEFPNRLVREAFLAMLRRDAELDVVQHEHARAIEVAKLEAMKELAYGASHEINNPLANISSRAQLLLRGEQDAKRRKSLETINRQAFRAHEMIADMMLFAKPPAVKRQPRLWSEFCSEALVQLKANCPRDIELVTETTSRDATVRLDDDQLYSAIQAIWKNALEAMGDKGKLHWRVAISDGMPCEQTVAWAQLELRDSGPGISAAARQHLFDPFYSGREAGRGLGFGLAKAWRILQLHEGQIEVADDANAMTSLTIRLPVAVRPPSEGDA